MTFDELKTEVLSNIIDTPQAVQDNVGAYVNRAIRKLEDNHNFYAMRGLMGPQLTSVGTNTLLNVPADFKDWRDRPFRVEYLGRVVPLVLASGPTEAKIGFGVDPDLDMGLPLVLVRDNTSGTDVITVWPLADGNSDWSDGEYRIYIPYWKFLAKLVADADTNWFTLNAEEWIIKRATALGFEADHDLTNATYWQQQAQLEYAEVVRTDKRTQLQGIDTLVPHLGQYDPRLPV